MIMLNHELWNKIANKIVEDYFNNYAVYDDHHNTIDTKNIESYVNNVCRNEILEELYTGEEEYVPGVGLCSISLYDYFSHEMENSLIEEFYKINRDNFGEDIENFTDYFLSEHVELLKKYIYDLLDNFSEEQLIHALKLRDEI